MTPDRAADVIREEAVRRYMNDPKHRAQVRMATDLVKEPADVSPQAVQLVRTGALLASSLALVVADHDFMADLQAQVDADGAVRLVEKLIGTRRAGCDMPQD
jgi:hypothetical protein